MLIYIFKLFLLAPRDIAEHINDEEEAEHSIQLEDDEDEDEVYSNAPEEENDEDEEDLEESGMIVLTFFLY